MRSNTSNVSLRLSGFIRHYRLNGRYIALVERNLRVRIFLEKALSFFLFFFFPSSPPLIIDFSPEKKEGYPVSNPILTRSGIKLLGWW